MQHAVWLRDILPNPVTMMSPYEKRNGYPPKQDVRKLQGSLFCKCYAKVYTHGKMERDAMPCTVV